MRVLVTKGAAWATLAVLAVITLGPARLRPRLSFDPATDRVLGFAALGYGLMLAYPRRPRSVALLVVLAAAGLELGQLAVPGRHARPADALAKATGGLVGVTLAALPWAMATRSAARAPALGGHRRGAE